MLEYDAEVSGEIPERPSFEFKLQSGNAAHIEKVPIGLDESISIPLCKYVKDHVDLATINRIVIAANCEQIGQGSRLDLRLKRIRWS